jgi:uncharacterized protein (TIGR02001 family)
MKNPVLCAAVASFATVAHAELEGELTAVSDYDFRGVSLSAREPALQGGATWTFGDSGLSAGAWASNVDFGPDYDADFELDFTVDYERALGENAAFYAGVSLYTYPGGDVDSSPEAYVGVGLGDFELLQWFTHDYSGSGLTGFYTEANYTHALGEAWSVTAHLGYSYGKAFEQAEVADFALGLEYAAGDFVLGAAIVGTDASGDLRVREDVFNNEPRLVVSIGTTLPWK